MPTPSKDFPRPSNNVPKFIVSFTEETCEIENLAGILSKAPGGKDKSIVTFFMPKKTCGFLIDGCLGSKKKPIHALVKARIAVQDKTLCITFQERKM